jgi:hypothetical protein
MDDVSKATIINIEDMKARFVERADAVAKSGMPPLEGIMRRKWIQQKEADYQDFLMVSDCTVEVIDGFLTLSLDLRPAICDATMRNTPNGIINKSAERETHVAMENIAKALPTDGNKITPKMLDSKTDLQDLIDGAEMFRVVEQVEPIVTKKKIKRRIGLSGYNPNFEYGGESG